MYVTTNKTYYSIGSEAFFVCDMDTTQDFNRAYVFTCPMNGNGCPPEGNHTRELKKIGENRKDNRRKEILLHIERTPPEWCGPVHGVCIVKDYVDVPKPHFGSKMVYYGSKLIDIRSYMLTST